MQYKIGNINDQKTTQGDNTLSSLLNKKGNNILRDSYIVISPEDTASGKLTVGFTAVYPGCSTNGHKHSEYEEIYLITKGQGIAQIEEEEFEIKAGDIFYVPFGLFHKVTNPKNENLEYSWVLNKKK